MNDAERLEERSRQAFPWDLLLFSVLLWVGWIALMWYGLRSVLLAFSMAYWSLDFASWIPWAVCSQLFVYLLLLLVLRYKFMNNRKPHLLEVYAALALTISAALSCAAVLAYRRSDDMVPEAAHTAAPQVSLLNPLGESMAGKVQDQVRVDDDNEEQADPAPPPPKRESVYRQPFWRRVGQIAQNLLDDNYRFKWLLLFLALPLGLLLNRDLLRQQYGDVSLPFRAYAIVAAVSLLSIFPAILFAFLQGYIWAWIICAGSGNFAIILLYRKGLRELVLSASAISDDCVEL